MSEIKRKLFAILQISSLFPAIAVLLLPQGDKVVGVQPFHLVLALALPFMLIGATLRVRLRTLLWVLIFIFFSILSILFSPGELPMPLVGTTNLSPIGQFFYWLVAMITLLVFQSYALSSKNTVAKDWRPFILGAFVVSLIGFYQIAAYYFGLYYPADWFNNNPSFLQRYGDTIWGIKRLTSTFPEASMYGLCSTGALFISLAFRGKWWGFVRLVILSSSILTLSTTAFLGIAMFFVWLSISYFRRLRYPYQKALFMLSMSAATIPLFFGLYMVLTSKANSESGFERYSSFVSGTALWLQSPLIGWGLGSGRTTDGLSNLLLNFGLIGTLLLLVIILDSFFVKMPTGCTPLKSLKAGLVAIGVLHLASNSDWIFPYFWMLLGYISGKVKAGDLRESSDGKVRSRVG